MINFFDLMNQIIIYLYLMIFMSFNFPDDLLFSYLFVDLITNIILIDFIIDFSIIHFNLFYFLLIILLYLFLNFGL
jgi:hypothetical protein